MSALPRVVSGPAPDVAPERTGDVAPATSPDAVVIRVRDLRKSYAVRRGLLARPRSLNALSGVSFDVEAGGTFGLVGESGSGKSTIARILLSAESASGGEVSIDGRRLGHLAPVQQKAFHRAVQPVLQDPYATLSPLMRIEALIDEPLRVHGLLSPTDRRARVAELLDMVGLRREFARRFPHELSGGQRQRVAIARALSVDPDVLVLDEPVSALDVSVQAQILNLLADLQRERGLTYVLISHDLAVVAYMSTRIGVLYVGEFMELGSRDDLLSGARHPYTQALMAASESDVDAASVARGEIPSPIGLPAGCRFTARCPHAIARCRVEQPRLQAVSQTHAVACHRLDDIPSVGVSVRSA